MKKINKYILITSTVLAILGSSKAYAKLPVEYDNFTVKGKTQKLALADLTINGVTIDKKTVGVVPVTINSRTLVPVRALSEQLGYKVTWVESLQKITIESPNTKIELVIGNSTAKVNGKSVTITDNVSPMILDSSTYVPIRFVVENMGLKIDYDAKENKISLNSDMVIFDSTTTPSEVSPVLPTETKTADNKTEPSNQDVNNAIVDDPSVPKDVEKFIIQPSTPTQVETTPVKEPTAEDNSTPGVSVQATQTQQTNKVVNEITSTFTKDGAEVFSIIQNSGNIDVSYYFLANPKKLVVDVRNANINMYESSEKTLGGNAFISSSASYNEVANYTRYIVNISENVNTDDIKLNVRANVFEVIKEKDYVADSSQKEVFKYSFERKSGTIDIKTTREMDLRNDSNSNNNIEISIPKDSIKLTAGNMNVSNRMIKSIEISENSTNYVVYISLGDRVTYNISKVGPNTNRISLTKQDRAKPLIVIDPGHGAQDNGASNKEFNVTEKRLNLEVAKKLKPKLENAGYEVIMTREEDSFISLNNIASFANNYDPDIFISIHHNSASNSTANGIETFYYASSDSKELAEIIRRHLISKSGANDRGTKNAGYVVIKKTTSPATLLELGFMSNRAEVQKNMSDQYQEVLTDAITSGVNEYFGR